MREMHWHPNADEWQYYVKGTAQMMVVGAGRKAVTTNFAPGDIGYINRSNGRYVKNIGDTDLVFLEVFNASQYASISLSDWLAHTPRAMVTAHFNISPEDIAKIPKNIPDVVPL